LSSRAAVILSEAKDLLLLLSRRRSVARIRSDGETSRWAGDGLRGADEEGVIPQE
jgi:hypothetical protein